MNTEEDEFRRIEREAKRRAAFQRKVDNAMRIAFEAAWDDDDTQVYAKPWVGLTEEERASFWTADQMTQKEWDELFDAIEAKLKEKNT